MTVGRDIVDHQDSATPAAVTGDRAGAGFLTDLATYAQDERSEQQLGRELHGDAGLRDFRLLASGRLADCFARQLFRFALGHVEGAADAPVVDALSAGNPVASGSNFVGVELGIEREVTIVLGAASDGGCTGCNGCCGASGCLAASPTSCGLNGSTCVVCTSMGADTCGSDGQCHCGGGPVCHPSLPMPLKGPANEIGTSHHGLKPVAKCLHPQGVLPPALTRCV